MKDIGHFLFALLLAATLTSCYEDSITETSVTELFPPSQLTRVSLEGNVLDTLGNPISGVVITAMDQDIVTDQNGYFIFDQVNVPEQGSFVSAEHSSYYEGGVRIYASEALNIKVSISLVPKGSSQSFNSNSTAELLIGDMGTVSVPADAFEDDGQLYNGEVDLEIYTTDPTNPNNFQKQVQVYESLPEQGTTNLQKPDLISIIYIEAYGENGQELQIKEGVSITVDFPGNGVNTLNVLNLYSFNDEIGFWKVEGSAIENIDKNYEAEISHFSWWGVGAQQESINLCIDFQTEEITDNHFFTISRTNGSVVYSGTVDYTNTQCFPAAPNETLELRVYNECFVQVYREAVPEIAIATTLEVVVVERSNVSIRIDVLGCASELYDNPVTVYYATQLSLDSLGIYTGVIDFELDRCFQGDQVFIAVIDQRGNQMYNYGIIVQITPDGPVYDEELTICMDVNPENHLLLNGEIFNNAIGRQNKEETLIISEDSDPPVVIGFDGFGIGEFSARMIGYGNQIFCEGTVIVEEYGEIGDLITGKIQIPAMPNLGCSEVQGEFRVVREK